MRRIQSLLIAGLVVSAFPAASVQAGCWPYPAFLAPAPVYIYPACNVSPGVVWYPAPPAWQVVTPLAKPEEKPAAPKAAQPQAAAQPSLSSP